MSRFLWFSAGVLTLALAGLGWWLARPAAADAVFEARSKPPEAAPLCPWREPETDLRAFFPEASRYDKDLRILSGLRPELTAQLGRAPTGDENALHIYHVYRDTTALGSIVTRRVKGENGAIELVLAVGADGAVRGLRFQRMREPEPVAGALQDETWLRSFIGKRPESRWTDLPEVPPPARASAEAVIEGTKSLLILLAAADQPQVPGPAAVAHH